VPKAPSADVSVTLVSVDDLMPFAGNARTHDDKQVAQIVDSIRQFGFTNPIVADMDDGGVIAAGHGRLMAVKLMLAAKEKIKLPNGKPLPVGMLPVMNCSGWSEDQRRAYTLADNKIAENSGWDDELLKAELVFLHDEDFTPGLMGFSDDEFDKLTLDPSAFKPGKKSDQGKLDTLTPQPVTCPGCGEHFDARQHVKK